MLRALWFFIQIAIVVCAALWLMSQSGAVDIQWNNYTFKIQLGLFLLGFVLFTLVVFVIFRFVSSVISIPEIFSKHRKERRREKGFKSLTRGLAAIAAGDSKKATQYAKEARAFLPDERGLPFLLEAQAARLRGDEDTARKIFEQLLDDKDAGFFGVRGLLKSSLDAGDTLKALGYAQTALNQNPKQPWILKSVYDLQIQNGQWIEAYDTLTRLRKVKGMEEGAIKKDEITLLILLGDRAKEDGREDLWLRKLEQANKMDPSFVPVILRLSDYFLSRNKNNKVASLVERAWKDKPHPDLLELWDKIAPAPKSSDPSRRLRWFEKLVALKPDDSYAMRGAAKAAMDCALWGVARTYLDKAEKIRASSHVYRLYARLEEKTTHNEVVMRDWLEKAAAARPEPVWYCTQTGHVYESWSPIAVPHGAFNTIIWGLPNERVTSATPSILSGWNDPLLIEQL